jgi:hypothetical protein
MRLALPHDARFGTVIHGTVFGDRAAVASRLRVGDRLLLVPDPPRATIRNVWLHVPGGDVVGHLPPEVAYWLAPWMFAGGRAGCVVTAVQDAAVASYERYEVEVELRAAGDPAG